MGRIKKLSAEEIGALLPVDGLFSGKVRVEDQVDSTNNRLKALAVQGAPSGTALLAEEQTGGRGTHGRAFQSPKGDGLYLSALLRPRAEMNELLTITGWVAVAARAGIAYASGAPCRIKWLNDIYLNGRKLAGILTEIVHAPAGGPDGVVVGIGVNVSQSAETFSAQGLGEIAASLAGEGYPVDRNRVAAAILTELEQMMEGFPARREAYLAEYRSHCLSVGRAVAFQENGRTLQGRACGIGEDFTLLVEGEDARQHRIFSGTVQMLD